MAKVDIIVAIYNIEDYLRRNLDSFVNQTFKDFRVLCVNDGSKDSCESIIKEYAAKDSRFVLVNKENGGLSDARNYGMKYLEAKYLMFVDGDDYLEPNYLEECMRRMDDNDLDMFVFTYNQFNLENNTKEFIKMKIEDGIYNIEDNPEILAYTPNAAWNKCYKSSLFLDNMIEYPFGIRYEDLGTTPKLILKAKKIEYKNIALYNYTIDRPNNIMTQTDRKLMHIIEASNNIINYYIDNGVFEKYKYELAYLIVRNIIPMLRKAMYLKDAKFVLNFISECFKLEEKYFNFENTKYNYIVAEDDKVYRNSKTLKAYYLLKRIKG